jgi:galactose mutarotase-like enzyme
MYPGDTFSDYLIEFEKAETSFCPALNTETRLVEQNRRRDFLSNSNILNLNHLMFDDDALIFDTLLSRKVSLLNKVRRQGIEIAYPGFEMLGIWTPSRKSAPFLCIEPWNGTATYTDEDDDLRHKRGIQSLMSRETRQYEVFLNIVG